MIGRSITPTTSDRLAKTVHSELYVRAIKIEIGPSTHVELRYKGSPSNPDWSGIDEIDDLYPEAEGFVMLKSYPSGAPAVLPATVDPDFVRTVRKDLSHSQVIEVARSCQMESSLEWLKQMAEGTIPTQGVTRNAVMSKVANFGSVEVVGVNPRTIDLPIIRPSDMTLTQMFQLPDENLQAQLDRQHRLESVRVTDRDARLTFTRRKRKQTSTVKKSIAQTARRLFSSSQSQSHAAENHSDDEKHRGDHSQDEIRDIQDNTWGAKIEDCNVGVYAAVCSHDLDAYGLSILQVLVLFVTKF